MEEEERKKEEEEKVEEEEEEEEEEEKQEKGKEEEKDWQRILRGYHQEPMKGRRSQLLKPFILGKPLKSECQTRLLWAVGAG